MRNLSLAIGLTLSVLLASCLLEVDTSEQAGALTTPEQNIIPEGCDADPNTDPNAVCEGTGGGGSGGGGGGGGGGYPGGGSCPTGWRYEPVLGYCVHIQWGQECAFPQGGHDSGLETCYFTQSGECRAYRLGGDCRCPYGYHYANEPGTNLWTCARN